VKPTTLIIPRAPSSAIIGFAIFFSSDIFIADWGFVRWQLRAAAIDITVRTLGAGCRQYFTVLLVLFHWPELRGGTVLSIPKENSVTSDPRANVAVSKAVHNYIQLHALKFRRACAAVHSLASQRPLAAASTNARAQQRRAGTAPESSATLDAGWSDDAGVSAKTARPEEMRQQLGQF
jgi:hypothetical protein